MSWQDTAVILGREAQRLAAEAETARGQAERIGAVLERVSQAQAADAAASLADLQQLYEQLRADYPEEYLMYNLPAIALTQVANPLLQLTCVGAHVTLPQQDIVALSILSLQTQLQWSVRSTAFILLG